MIRVADNLNGTISGRYQLQGKLGEGGMGSAFRALDRITGRTVALKRLDGSNVKFSALFEREYHTLASLKHPCVIEVYDFGIAEDGSRYYTMELLDGADLSQRTEMPWRTVCQQLRDIATSLALLHVRRLVHRDVSPRNIRIAASGRAKLLDFGTVAPFGRAVDVAGTPSCIAPEVVRGLELDARADLFSLGVVAYWTLTGHRPYTVSRLADAESGWRVKPRPLSEVTPDVPRALEQLVMSLLHIDPGGRPASAAEVIDRLVAIADLDDAPLEGLTHSHLSSCALIGREREAEQFTQHFERATRGQGGVVLVEGAAGMGKSRLTAEVTIQASLLGLTTLRLDALEHTEPSGLVAALVRSLTEVAPAEAAETLPAHGVLFRALPALEKFAIAPVTTELLPSDPIEQRALVHNAIASWLVDVASRRPLVVLVDNAHQADQASAAALLTIAHACQHARIVCVATLLRDAPTPVAIQQIVRIGSRIRLRPLAPEALGELMRSVFGDVPHLGRLTTWIQNVAAGVPGQALELLAQLAERGVIRYAGGSWVLPNELSEDDLPTTLDDALSRCIAQLEPAALRLARLLALHHVPASITLCQRLLPELSPTELWSALDQLVTHQVLVGSRETYRIRQDMLRALLVAELEPGVLAQLHHSIGDAILKSLPAEMVKDARRGDNVRDLALLLQAGWHLLHAGEGRRARRILRDAGMELAHRGDGFAEALPALEAALAEYERLGLSQFERAYLMIPLTLAGVHLDWRLSYRHGEPLIDLLCKTIGLTMARRVRPWLGRKLALGIGLAWAYVTSKLPSRRLIARDFREMVLCLLAVASPVLGATSSLLDAERARHVVRRLEPLGWFPRDHLLRWVHEFYIALADCASGDYATALERCRAVLSRLRSPLSGLHRDGHRQLEAGVLLAVGSLEIFRTDGSVHSTFEALSRIETWAARLSAAGIRANYHGGRGERALYEKYREELDVFAAQSGSTWRQDILMPRNEWWAAAMCEDVLGLKRAARKLEQLAEDHPTLVGTRDAAHAAYLLERGRAAEALSRYGGSLDLESRVSSLHALRFVATYSRVLRTAGQAARARTLCETALARTTRADRDFTGLVHYVEVELALAHSDLGSCERAAAELDRLIEEQAHHDNALVHGFTHRSRAHVAMLQRDATAFEQHLRAMEEWYARTQNQALIAQHQRVAEEGRRAGLLGVKQAKHQVRANRDLDEVRRAFLDRRGPSERVHLAVELLAEKSGAAAAYLYLLEPAGLRFAAPMIGVEPPAELQRELAACVAAHGAPPPETEALAHPDALRTVVETDEERAERRVCSGATYSYVLLTLPRGRSVVIVGAIALVPGDEPLEALDRAYLEEVTRGIYDAGDVQTVYFERERERAS